jgi:Asp-tRNA(Asn)/Glu-tRNA(Gln) amidotransferase A subunit family amidase
VIFGKTATPELGRTATTESTLFGATRNPWNTEFSSGGSSGGAAAAVAAGILPAAHATDGGGSIRIPAALCGLFGMKPTRLRTPVGPDRGEGWGGLSIAHAVTRSVRDSALILDLSQGPEPGAAHWPPPPAAPYMEEINREPGRLRVGVVRASAIGSTIDPDCMAALERAAALCSELGHELVEFTLPASAGKVMLAMGTLMAAGLGFTVRERALAIGREPGPEDLEEANFTAYQQAQKISAIDLEFARQAASRFGFEMNEAMQGVDVLLSPTCARAPWKNGVIHLAQSQESFYRNVSGVSDFTSLFNVTGQPAMSVPLHTGSNALPVGVQFAARYGEEGLLFRLAAQLERAAPWKDRLSPLATKGIV